MELFVLWIVISWIAAIAFTGGIAEAKGYNSGGWFVAAIFLGPVAFIAACGMPDKEMKSMLKTAYNLEEKKDIKITPKDAWACNERGVAYAKKGEYGPAISDYTKAIEINPKYAIAYYNRGCAHYHKSQYNQATSDFNKAIEINPNGEIGQKVQKKLHELRQMANLPLRKKDEVIRDPKRDKKSLHAFVNNAAEKLKEDDRFCPEGRKGGRKSRKKEKQCPAKTIEKPQPESTYFCGQCSAELKGDDRFCPECGVEVGREK